MKVVLKNLNLRKDFAALEIYYNAGDWGQFWNSESGVVKVTNYFGGFWESSAMNFKG